MMILIAAALALANSGVDEPQQAAETLRYLVGTWHVVSVDPGGGDELRVCYSVQPFVGKKWISGVATSTRPGFASKDVWGYDRASGELVRTIFDASGTYAIVRSPGWKGDTLVLDGNAKSAAGTMRVRETIRRLSENEFKATWEALRGGKWSAYAIETATRVLSGKCITS
jgi:hypothetical protein